MIVCLGSVYVCRVCMFVCLGSVYVCMFGECVCLGSVYVCMFEGVCMYTNVFSQLEHNWVDPDFFSAFSSTFIFSAFFLMLISPFFPQHSF